MQESMRASVEAEHPHWDPRRGLYAHTRTKEGSNERAGKLRPFFLRLYCILNEDPEGSKYEAVKWVDERTFEIVDSKVLAELFGIGRDGLRKNLANWGFLNKGGSAFARDHFVRDEPRELAHILGENQERSLAHDVVWQRLMAGKDLLDRVAESHMDVEQQQQQQRQDAAVAALMLGLSTSSPRVEARSSREVATQSQWTQRTPTDQTKRGERRWRMWQRGGRFATLQDLSKLNDGKGDVQLTMLSGSSITWTPKQYKEDDFAIMSFEPANGGEVSLERPRLMNLSSVSTSATERELDETMGDTDEDSDGVSTLTSVSSTSTLRDGQSVARRRGGTPLPHVAAVCQEGQEVEVSELLAWRQLRAGEMVWCAHGHVTEVGIVLPSGNIFLTGEQYVWGNHTCHSVNQFVERLLGAANVRALDAEDDPWRMVHTHEEHMALKHYRATQRMREGEDSLVVESDVCGTGSESLVEELQHARVRETHLPSSRRHTRRNSMPNLPSARLAAWHSTHSARERVLREARPQLDGDRMDVVDAKPTPEGSCTRRQDPEWSRMHLLMQYQLLSAENTVSSSSSSSSSSRVDSAQAQLGAGQSPSGKGTGRARGASSAEMQLPTQHPAWDARRGLFARDEANKRLHTFPERLFLMLAYDPHGTLFGGARWCHAGDYGGAKSWTRSIKIVNPQRLAVLFRIGWDSVRKNLNNYRFVRVKGQKCTWTHHDLAQFDEDPEANPGVPLTMSQCMEMVELVTTHRRKTYTRDSEKRKSRDGDRLEEHSELWGNDRKRARV